MKKTIKFEVELEENNLPNRIIMKSLFVFLITAGNSMLFSECDNLLSSECSGNCEWVEDLEYGNCSNLSGSDCTQISDCSWTSYQQACSGTVYSDCVSQPGCSYSWLTYSCTGSTTVSNCSGGNYEIDNGYCQEVEFPECSENLSESICNNGDGDTDLKKGIGKMYQYTYTPKNMRDETGDDSYLIDTIVFPDEKSYLMGLRHGTWAGYSVGFDPVSILRSRWGVSTDMKSKEYRYGVKKLWRKMAHIGKSNAVNPISGMDPEIRNIVDFPKRVRYTMLPNQIFDPKYKNNPQKNYQELVELQAYQWMRIETLKNLRMQINIPGNLDLYCGSGIDL